LDDDDFAQEFARQMEAMLHELVAEQDPSSSTTGGENAGDGPGADADNSERDRAFRVAWERMLEKSMDNALSGPDGDKDATEESEDAFQKNVKEAMERLRRSDTDLQVTLSRPILYSLPTLDIPIL